MGEERGLGGEQTDVWAGPDNWIFSPFSGNYCCKRCAVTGLADWFLIHPHIIFTVVNIIKLQFTFSVLIVLLFESDLRKKKKKRI